MVLLVDLSELFIRGIPAMHERVAAVYGADVASWFRKRKERMNPIFLDLMRGESTLTAYWEIFCEDSDRPNNVRASNLQNLFCDELKEKIPGTREVFESIVAHPRSLRRTERDLVEGRPEIIMVSDHIRECVDLIKACHPEVFKLFSREVWSFDRGELKSDPGFFDHLLEDLRIQGELPIRARDVLFVDDLICNCESACRSHIRSIRFTGARDLAKSLKDEGFVLKASG